MNLAAGERAKTKKEKKSENHCFRRNHLLRFNWELREHNEDEDEWERPTERVG